MVIRHATVHLSGLERFGPDVKVGDLAENVTQLVQLGHTVREPAEFFQRGDEIGQ